jgi:toxin ParE1/3/4
MTLIYHRSVPRDVSEVLAYYDEVGGPELGDAFFSEFMAHVAQVIEHPTRFHPIEGDLRRANLDRFPYHFLFRVHDGTIRVLVLRHHHRNPGFGIQRK